MAEQQPIPVYVFCGMLESGKTTFLRDILSDPDFTEDEKSLLLLCEQGVEELDEDDQHAFLTVSVEVERESDLTPIYLKKLEMEHNPDRVLVEYNGMWKLDKLLEAMPGRWQLYQIVTMVNAQTFERYQSNLGPMMFEHLSNADLIVFNRCTEELKQMLYQKNIRAINPRATIYLDDVDGNSEDYVRNMPLPFDIDAELIEIADTDFGLWYVDAMGDGQKYVGKKVRFLAQVYLSDKIPSNAFVPGRFGMVCCADDIKFIGMLCWYEGTDKLEQRQWVRVTAEMGFEHAPQYREPGPVLRAISVEPAEPAEDDIVYFN